MNEIIIGDLTGANLLAMGTIILNSFVFIYVVLKIMSPVITTFFLNP